MLFLEYDILQQPLTNSSNEIRTHILLRQPTDMI